MTLTQCASPPVVLTRYYPKKKEFKVKKLVGGKHDEAEVEKPAEEEEVTEWSFIGFFVRLTFR